MMRLAATVVNRVPLFLALATLALPGGADEHLTFAVGGDIEIDIRHLGEAEAIGLVWFACNQGEESGEFAAAQKLLRRGYQAYFPDMLSAHFLSSLPSSIARVPGDEVAAVIARILQETTAERVFIVAGGRAAVPVLRGLADTRLLNASPRLGGALLITPRLTGRKPEPGMDPVYIAEVGHSVQPLLILEGERTPNRWGLPHLAAALAASGSPVETGLIDGVRGYFYLRTDQTEAEARATRDLDELVHAGIRQLETMAR